MTNNYIHVKHAWAGSLEVSWAQNYSIIPHSVLIFLHSKIPLFQQEVILTLF